VAQCVELFNQRGGDAAHQVGGARIVVAHNIGGLTAESAVTIAEGPGTYGG
jgi:acetyl-CoA C-acetyltransferase